MSSSIFKLKGAIVDGQLSGSKRQGATRGKEASPVKIRVGSRRRSNESVYYQPANRNAMLLHGHGCRLF